MGFFENEAEDYKKEVEAKTPDYDQLLKKAGDKKMDFSLKSKIFEVNRDADRRYKFAAMKIAEAERNGEKFPPSSPLVEPFWFKNDDEDSHKTLVEVMEMIKGAAADPSCPPETKKMFEETVAQGVPAMGEAFGAELPSALVTQLNTFSNMFARTVEAQKANMTDAEFTKFEEEELPGIWIDVANHLIKKYVETRDMVEQEVEEQKTFFRSQAKYKDDKTRTKADVLKEVWAELPKYTEKPLPPIDEELLAELAEMPAVVEGEFMHSWGTADVLYKSEAIDAFGGKYLLGVFETKEEAQKAFEDWNGEYEKARSTMKDELEQWGKQEQARLDADPEPMERIKKVLEQARR